MADMKMKSTDRITIAGLPGTGKTTLMRYLAALASPDILIYDPLDQYYGFADECRYIPRSDSVQEFEGVCARVRARGNITFFIEECERYIGQGKPLGDNAFDLVNRGRNYGVGIVANTRRIQMMSKSFFDLCQHIFFFKCGLTSRDYVDNLIGREAGRKVASLPPYHFLHYDLRDETFQIATLVLPRKAPGQMGPSGEQPERLPPGARVKVTSDSADSGDSADAQEESRPQGRELGARPRPGAGREAD